MINKYHTSAVFVLNSMCKCDIDLYKIDFVIDLIYFRHNIVCFLLHFANENTYKLQQNC